MAKKYPNILLLVMDSVRSDHLSCYGYPIQTSPQIDALATTGTAFTQAISAANWTGSSVSSILTGLYPSRHGYTNLNYHLDEEIITVPQLLADNGYRTIGISSNLFISSKTGTARGFHDFYFNGRPDVHGSATHLKRKSFLQKQYTGFRDLLPIRYRMMAKDLYDGLNEERALTRDDGAFVNCQIAKKWLKRRDKTQPFFMYIHFEEPHSNYFPPRPYRKRFFAKNWPAEYRYLIFDHMNFLAKKITYSAEDFRHYKSLYDAAIAYTDLRIGELIDHLKENGAFDDTVIIITADHGDLFGEKGYVWHAFNLYDPLIHVPLIIHYPEWFGHGLNPQLVQSVDILPSLLDRSGIRWQYKNERHGLSLFDPSPRTFTISETFNPKLVIERWLTRDSKLKTEDFDPHRRDLLAIRSQTEKFIWSSDGKHEYYHLSQDPEELHNIFTEKETSDLVKTGFAWSKSFAGQQVQRSQAGFDKDTWEKLKAMGYA